VFKTNKISKRYTWEEVNMLIMITTANIIEKSLLRTFRPSANYKRNYKLSLSPFKF